MIIASNWARKMEEEDERIREKARAEGREEGRKQAFEEMRKEMLESLKEAYDAGVRDTVERIRNNAYDIPTDPTREEEADKR